MKTKNFQSYLEKRLDKADIAKIEHQAKLEVEILRSIQDAISNTLAEYMKTHDVGFNELVKRLNSSPSHVSKIQRGEANLTLSSLAHLFALLGKKPRDMFKSNK
jgi:transcriptional regulator with XRE-family HTH domain